MFAEFGKSGLEQLQSILNQSVVWDHQNRYCVLNDFGEEVVKSHLQGILHKFPQVGRRNTLINLRQNFSDQGLDIVQAGNCSAESLMNGHMEKL